MDNLAVLVINLDRSGDRRERMAAALASLNMDWRRVDAVEGTLISEADRRRFLDEPLFERLHGMRAVPGELGCYLSHVKAIRQFLAGPAQYALVLEDDVQPDDDLPEVLDALMRCPDRWDMVKLSAVHSGTPILVHPLNDRHGLAVMLSRCTGASAYLINRRAAQTYDGGLLPMSPPYDHVFDQGWRFGLKVRLVTPVSARHGYAMPTTIDQPAATARSRSPRKFHWTRRLPAFAHRLANEGRRLRYALGELWRERLARDTAA